MPNSFSAPTEPFKAQICALKAFDDQGESLKSYVNLALTEREGMETHKLECVKMKVQVVTISDSDTEALPPTDDNSSFSSKKILVDNDQTKLIKLSNEIYDNHPETCPTCEGYQADQLDGELYIEDEIDPRIVNVSPDLLTDAADLIKKECELHQHIYGVAYKQRYRIEHEAIGDGPYQFFLICMSDDKRKSINYALKNRPNIGTVVNSLGKASMFIYDSKEADNISKPDKFRLILAALVGRLIRPIEFLQQSIENNKVLKVHAVCSALPPPTDFLRIVESVSIFSLSIINTGEYQFPLTGRNIILCMPAHTNKFIYDFLVLQGASVGYFQPGEFIKNNTLHMAICNDLKDAPPRPLLHKVKITEFKQFIINSFRKYYVLNRLYPGGTEERQKLKVQRDLKFERIKKQLIENNRSDLINDITPEIDQPIKNNNKNLFKASKLKNDDKENESNEFELQNKSAGSKRRFSSINE